jgi:ribosomal protein L11 methyltransferase
MTFAATVVLPEALARAAAERIGEEAGFASVGLDREADEQSWRLTVYLEHEPDQEQRAVLEDALLSAGARAPRFRFARLPETDWVAKSLAGLSPVRAGRFLVHGAHDRHRVLPNDLSILIDAGQAFGTGHHGTTAGCLIAIGRAARQRPIRNALDIGTGSGVLAIATAKLTKARVLASDIDPLAVAVARDNVRRNGVSEFVRVIAADGLRAGSIEEHAPYDLIAANILATPLISLAPDIRRHVAPGGAIIVSGLLAAQERRVSAIYRGQGFRRMERRQIGGWVTLTFEA